MTEFQEVYSFFLSKITTNEYLDLNEEELEITFQQILKSALPKCTSFKGRIKADYDMQWFNKELSDLEKEIIANWMVVEYLSPKIRNINLLKQSLSSKDFQLYSQANHLKELMGLENTCKKEAHYWTNRYSLLSKIEESGI